MSLYSSCRNQFQYDSNYSFTMSKKQSAFSKSKQITQIFLDKKTIIKKMQKLMLDVKDLQTKMFISKTISFLDKNICSDIEPFHSIDLNKYDAKQNMKENDNSNLFANNCSDIKQQLNNNSISILTTIPINCQNNDEIVNESKFLSDTAASDGFFHSNKAFNQPKQSIIQQTVSQAGTIQCQCGLFQGLLQMISQLMESGIIKSRQRDSNQILQIDQSIINQICDQIIQNWKQIQNTQKKLKKQLVSVVQDFVKMESSFLQLSNVINSSKLQIQELRIKLSDSQKSVQKWQQQYLLLHKTKQQTDIKISTYIKQIQKSNTTRLLFEQSKEHEIEALNFTIELKDNQIDKMKTIIQSLQKNTKQCPIEFMSFKKIPSLKQVSQNVSIVINYSLNLNTNDYSIKNNTKAYFEQQNKLQRFRLNERQLSQMRIQNNFLKQQCLLLYEKLTNQSIFGQY